ncbi:hypothetical protein U1Q18_051581 [Sarracenia purpurea var. burkii]
MATTTSDPMGTAAATEATTIQLPPAAEAAAPMQLTAEQWARFQALESESKAREEQQAREKQAREEQQAAFVSGLVQKMMPTLAPFLSDASLAQPIGEGLVSMGTSEAPGARATLDTLVKCTGRLTEYEQAMAGKDRRIAELEQQLAAKSAEATRYAEAVAASAQAQAAKAQAARHPSYGLPAQHRPAVTASAATTTTTSSQPAAQEVVSAGYSQTMFQRTRTGALAHLAASVMKNPSEFSDFNNDTASSSDALQAACGGKRMRGV